MLQAWQLNHFFNPLRGSGQNCTFFRCPVASDCNGQTRRPRNTLFQLRFREVTIMTMIDPLALKQIVLDAMEHDKASLGNYREHPDLERTRAFHMGRLIAG